jgi:hypothetical protein
MMTLLNLCYNVVVSSGNSFIVLIGAAYWMRQGDRRMTGFEVVLRFGSDTCREADQLRSMSHRRRGARGNYIQKLG